MKLRSRTKGRTRIASFHYVWGARAWSLFFAAAATALFSFSALNPAALKGARMGAADLAAPVLAAVNAPVYKAADYVRAVSGLADLQEENERLRQENLRLRDWYQTALSLQSENESLQKLLNLRIESARKFVTARVVADSGSTFARSLLVLAGNDDNVTSGQSALAGDGLVGRVIESGRRSARVLLLTDINSRIPVMIQGTNQRAVMAGGNADLPTLLYLPPDIAVETGARVITSGHGGLFPYGLPVGEVVRNAQGRLAVKPFADIGRVQMVRIIQTPDDPRLQTAQGLP